MEAEVAFDAFFEIFGFADVENLALRVEVLVNPKGGGEIAKKIRRNHE